MRRPSVKRTPNICLHFLAQSSLSTERWKLCTHAKTHPNWCIVGVKLRPMHGEYGTWCHHRFRRLDGETVRQLLQLGLVVVKIPEKRRATGFLHTSCTRVQAIPTA